jgi:hypothetical protein
VVSATEDPLVTPDLKVRAAIALAQYQNPKPVRSGDPVAYVPPQTVEEARGAILTLGGRLAKGEITVELHDALVGGLRAYLGDRAADSPYDAGSRPRICEEV